MAVPQNPGYTGSNALSTAMPGCGSSYGAQNSDVAISLVQHASQVFTPAQIIAMYAAPVAYSAIPTPPTGSSIIVDYVLARFIYPASGGTQFTGGGPVILQYGNTVQGAGTGVANTLAAAVITAAASADTLLPTGSSNITLAQATGLYLSNTTAPFAAGVGSSLQIDVWFSVV